MLNASRDDKEQKLYDVLNAIIATHNAFIGINKKAYPRITQEVFQDIWVDIQMLSAKLEVICSLGRDRDEK